MIRFERGTRVLGAYLVACAIFQIAGAFYWQDYHQILNPRIGLFLFAHETAATIVNWASAVCLLCLGVVLATRPMKAVLVLYLVFECVLVSPTVVYATFSAFGDFGELTAGGLLLLQLLGIMLVFSVAPVVAAACLLRCQGPDCNAPVHPETRAGMRDHNSRFDRY